MLQEFCDSLKKTFSLEQLVLTECIVGIDVDDPVFQNPAAKERIVTMIPCKTVFVQIQPELYGKVCKIWNCLAHKATNDYIVLLGDDVRLMDPGWQEHIVGRFQEIACSTGLPLGAACVALNDISFPGFPTFPVMHQRHVEQFGSLLPKHFVNQGGDPYLYELYSRFNAAAFQVSCRLNNTIGGDGAARYRKYRIKWRGQILTLSLRHLNLKLCRGESESKGVCLDIVVPSYRINNNDVLERIAMLRATVNVYVNFWFVLDNPSLDHVATVKHLANELNEKQVSEGGGNYFINVIHYGKNRGAIPRLIGSCSWTTMSFRTSTYWTPTWAPFSVTHMQRRLWGRPSYLTLVTFGPACSRLATWATFTVFPSSWSILHGA